MPLSADSGASFKATDGRLFKPTCQSKMLGGASNTGLGLVLKGTSWIPCTLLLDWQKETKIRASS